MITIVPSIVTDSNNDQAHLYLTSVMWQWPVFQYDLTTSRLKTNYSLDLS